MARPLWPLFDLRLSTERLVLRLPTDAELATLCALARRGIHPPDEMPFAVPWSITPSPAFERGFAQYHWSQRAGWTAQRWMLEPGAFLDGEPVGAQAVGASDFATLRTVFTGSWLGAAFQGRGLGKEMRAAVLGLAFDHLGAEVATSAAFADNARSAGVSLALGYHARPSWWTTFIRWALEMTATPWPTSSPGAASHWIACSSQAPRCSEARSNTSSWPTEMTIQLVDPAPDFVADMIEGRMRRTDDPAPGLG